MRCYALRSISDNLPRGNNTASQPEHSIAALTVADATQRVPPIAAQRELRPPSGRKKKRRAEKPDPL